MVVCCVGWLVGRSVGRFAAWLVDGWSVGQLVGCLVGRSVGWLAAWLVVGWLVGWLVDWLMVGWSVGGNAKHFLTQC